MSRDGQKVLVYTALFGGYEALTEQPVARSSTADFICFTDDPRLTSETWQVRLIDRPLPGDVVRSCRILKIRGHQQTSHYGQTLWIDNAVQLRADPVEMMASWLVSAEVAVPWHSYRRDIASEFDAVATTGRDDAARIYEQLSVYADLFPEILKAEVLWTGLLARRHSPAVTEAMTVWLDQVLRYSRRDQLSLPLALKLAGIAPNVVELNNWESRWHQWPVTSGRPREREYQPEVTHGLPAVATLAQLHSDLDELTLQYAEAVKVREIEIVRLEKLLSDILQSRAYRWSASLRDVVRPAFDRLRGLR